MFLLDSHVDKFLPNARVQTNTPFDVKAVAKALATVPASGYSRSRL